MDAPHAVTPLPPLRCCSSLLLPIPEKNNTCTLLGRQRRFSQNSEYVGYSIRTERRKFSEI